MPVTPTAAARPIATLGVVVAIALAGCGGGSGGGSGGPGGGGGGGTASTAAPAPAPAPTPASERPAIGIGEQQAAMFVDKRFRELGIDKVRLVTAYDTVHVRFEREIVDNWLAQARRVGAEPFITFGHSRVHPARLPSVAEFRSDFRAFGRRYPDVRVYAPWNEINHASQPTARSPGRAAEYYNVVKAECAGCTVLAGDVLDQPGMVDYVKRYRSHLDGVPKVWGLHNYADTNRFRDSGLRGLLAAVPGEVWLTETGGLVQFGRAFPRDEARAARAVRFAIKLARENARVGRLYLYNWTGGPPDARFDAGLIAPDGTARPAFDALRAALRG
ncbi:MAG: hypothetical protein QOJ35_2502 [Solirubrobacteraceae bacterium]|nr:hypothetical protein [Solirubrobacteraceae bacterium]